jgi:hypothetical protein
MGTSQETACVDSQFRVFGLESLRVVDLSVCPFVPKYAYFPSVQTPNLITFHNQNTTQRPRESLLTFFQQPYPIYSLCDRRGGRGKATP